MHKKIAISRVFVCVLLLLLTASLVVSFVAPSLAYFQTIFTSTGINSAKVELIFDRLNFESENVLNATNEDGTARFDVGAEWGSEKNPYVISAKHHVQNLSVLQNTGFFDKATQAYFLVCTPEGTPVAINCEGMTMAPVGTHANPFTGVIDGAFATSATEVKYTYTPRSSSDTVAEKSYGVSVSTIGNLIVKASTSEPDIGFFGCVGYYGTPTVDPETNDPAVDGYAASIHNLLLADVTVSSVPTLKDSLAAWWAEVKATMQVEEGKEAPEHRHEDFESHHIGIVAGHADFATINNVSVFYTQGVQTFQISGSSYINYYSTTGLIGTLHYVNPTITSSGLLVGDGNSISDSDMVEVGLGGGGAISGTLTGYMLAETLFTEHEKYIAVEDHENIYDVKEMKDRNGAPLFSTVEMTEGTYFNNTEVTYYYFSDSVFTFTMSSSSKSSGSNIDYVQKIWDLGENSTRPSVSGTQDISDWQYTLDQNAKTRYAYKLTAITSAEEIAALNSGSGGYYVIAYHDKGPTDARVDDVLYILPIKNPDTPKGVAQAFAFSEFYESTENNVNTVWDGLEISEVSLPGTEIRFFDYAFLNTSGRTLSDPFSTEYALALYAKRSSTWLSNFSHPTAPEMSNRSTDSNDVSIDGDGTKEALVTNWQFQKDDETGKIAIFATYNFWGFTRRNRGAVAIGFDNGAFTFPFLAQDTSVSGDTIAFSLDNNYLFTIFKLTPNPEVNGTTQLDPSNVEIEPMSMKPAGETLYNFDPSKYAFKNVIGEDGKPTGKYTLAPIASYNLNTGKGTLLTELNHAVKLYEATSKNYQLKLSNTFLGGILGEVFDSNDGGVVEVQVGVTDPPVYATIPAGMLAFNILEASPEKPSYINMIVAINPEQLSPCTVGLWKMPDDDEWSMEFDLSQPDQSFSLPVSHYATSQTASSKYTIPVTQYTPDATDGKYTPVVGDSYVYLNGEVAFVFHTFQVEATGIYYIGSANGPMSVSYFSVSGAAGQGADGTSTSPLGDIDFVYENNGDIITIDKKFSGVQDTTNEDYSYYYPSYHFVVMKRDGTDSDHPSVQTENIWVYRYIDPNDETSPKRYISITGCDDAENKGLTDLYQDSSPPA